MGVQVIHIPTEVVSHSLPFQIQCFIPIPMGFQFPLGIPFPCTSLLGVTLDSVLTMDRHVTEVIRSCSYHTRALRHIRPLLTLDVIKMIGHSTVSSRLDYSNALLHGSSVYNINKLQVAQNSLVMTVRGMEGK